MKPSELATEVIGLQKDVQENTRDIHNLKVAMFGDNNGNKGVIRRLDAVGTKLNIILTLLVPMAGKIVYDWLLN